MMLPVINGEFGVVSDPEIRFAQSGKAWVSMRVVAKDRVRDSNGEWSDGEPMFLNAVVFGKQAENITESILKGDTVVISGKLRPNKWTDKDGVEHNDVQIGVDEIGVSVRWNPAKSNRMLESSGVSAASAPAEPQSDEAPF
jgi:single-strand DNA-binding protein